MKVGQPKGMLIPIGGGKDDSEIMARMIKESGKRYPKICYITVARSSAAQAKKGHQLFFKDFRKEDVSNIHFDLRAEADSPENLNKIKRCHIVYIGGGDQLRLTSLMGGSKLMALIKKRYYEEARFIVSGNSAGAVAMSTTMIIAGSSKDALVKGELLLTNGFGLINNVFIDTHFTERGRFGRVIQTVAYNPAVLGLGLSINTAAVIKKEKLEIIGPGLALIVDGSSIEYSDLAEIPDGDSMTIEGLKVHVLGKGKKFHINERKIQKR